MKVITINLPERYLDAIQILVNRRIFPSRSELVRQALGDFLYDEMKNYKNFEKEQFDLVIRSGNMKRR